MLRRFFAATAVASCLIALASAGTWLLAIPAEARVLLTALWCFVPLAWGVWALLAPPRIVPNYLPSWGAGLGLIVGVMAGFVLDMPAKVLGQPLPWTHWAALVIGPVAYYLFWMIVRAVYVRTTPASGQRDRAMRSAA